MDVPQIPMAEVTLNWLKETFSRSSSNALILRLVKQTRLSCGQSQGPSQNPFFKLLVNALFQQTNWLKYWDWGAKQVPSSERSKSWWTESLSNTPSPTNLTAVCRNTVWPMRGNICWSLCRYNRRIKMELKARMQQRLQALSQGNQRDNAQPVTSGTSNQHPASRLQIQVVEVQATLVFQSSIPRGIHF